MAEITFDIEAILRDALLTDIIATPTEEAPPIAPPLRKSTAELLRHAALIIEERGWHNDTKSYEKADGRVCAMGAINLAAHGHAGWGGSYDGSAEARWALKEYLNEDELSVEGWNDHWAYDARVVTDAMRGAADRLDA